MAVDLNILIGGAAGQGVHAISLPLAKALVRQGCRVLVRQDYQSRIRGGHLFNVMRVADGPLLSGREGADLLVALNQETVTLHQGELSPGGILIYDAAHVKEVPAGVRALALSHDALLPGAQAGEMAVNAGASGAILGLLQVQVAGLVQLLADTFADKGAEVVEWNRQAASRGHELGGAEPLAVNLADLAAPSDPGLLISGH